jgi:6-pyruvoyl-tetrahydropterin synthase
VSGFPYYLNETTGLENPTSEAIAKWVFEQLEEAALPSPSDKLTSFRGYSQRNKSVGS